MGAGGAQRQLHPLTGSTFMKTSGCSREGQGNPEQDSHRVLARGGAGTGYWLRRGPAALPKLHPCPFPLPPGEEQ